MLAVMGHHDLVDAACAGDEEAFRLLIEPHRGALYGHCLRMLGSVEDADDALQETLVRAWRGLPGIADGRSLGGWLRRIATNVALDAIDKRRRVPPVADAVEPEDVPVPPVTPQDPHASPADRYERREALEQAVRTALQHLPPRQHAVLILNDALGLSAHETAAALDTTRSSVYSALQRARASIDDGLPGPAAEGDGDVERLAAALEQGDVRAVLATLSG